MKKINLPPFSFSLDSSNASYQRYIKTINKMTKDLEQKENYVGTNSVASKDAYNALKTDLIINKKSICETVDSSIKIRALSTLLLEENNINITKNDLNHLLELNNRPSLLLLKALTSYFFRYYDQLQSITIDELGSWILNVNKIRKKKISSNDKILFSTNSIDWLLGKSKKNNSLDNIMKEEKLEQYKNTRFYNILQMTYYVKQLEKLEANESSALLDEVIKPEVYNTQYKNNKLLGHIILEILIDKIKDKVSKDWQKVVLQIAGDPRVSKNATSYRNWWSILGDNRVAKVRGWLSKIDIEMFLSTIQQYAENTNNITMQERFPNRKIFLKGLLKTKNVLETRLFLGEDIVRSLKQSKLIEEIPNYTRLMGNQYMAIIYMRLENDVHIVEGSYQFAYRIYQGLASNSPIYDYDSKYIDIKTLRELDANISKTIVHNYSNSKWQRDVVSILNKMGISINIEDVLSKEDYKIYKSRFGYTYYHDMNKKDLSQISESTYFSSTYKLKKCKKCGKTKPENLFYPSKKQKDGYSVWCRDCLNNN